MEVEYDEVHINGVLNGEIVPKNTVGREEYLSREVVLFLLFINDLNTGRIG